MYRRKRMNEKELHKTNSGANSDEDILRNAPMTSLAFLLIQSFSTFVIMNGFHKNADHFVMGFKLITTGQVSSENIHRVNNNPIRYYFYTQGRRRSNPTKSSPSRHRHHCHHIAKR